MLPYRFKCRKNTESKNQKFMNTKNGRIMVLSKCVACDSTESKIYQRARN